MHDHNLDDLIIDNIEPKNSKTKSFLTIIALLIVVLIVAIILTKILLKSPNDNGLAFEQDATEMIAPELKLQETPKVTKAKKEPSLSNIIEQELKAPVIEKKEPTVVIKETKTEEVVKKSVAIKKPTVTIKEEKTDEVIKESVTIKEPTVVIKETKTDEAVKESVAIKESIQVEKPVKPIEPKKIETPIVKTPKPIVKPVQKIVVPKPVKKPVITAKAPKTVSSKRYYVQVGSFKRAPSARFISVIKNTGFNYRITKPTANGTKKLLIGPYKDRASVNRALIRVRDRINKSAFVVKR